MYRGKDLQLGREVAIKVLHGSADEVFMARFRREAQILATLSHKNIVTVFAVEVLEESTPIVICEYLEGTSLKAYLQKHGRIGFEDFSSFLEQISSGLSYLHNAGIVHRDLSPSNIFLIAEGNSWIVKLLDFGMAKVFIGNQGQTLTSTGELLGTPMYMSPEQVRGMQVDGRSDIYALGCVLYECVSSKNVFSAATALELLSMHLASYPVEPDLEWADRERAELAKQILLRCLQKRVEKRFQTCEEIAVLLSTGSPVKGSSASSDIDGWSKPAAGSRQRNKVHSKILGSLALVIGALVVLQAGLFIFLPSFVMYLENLKGADPGFERLIAQLLHYIHQDKYSKELFEKSAKEFQGNNEPVKAANSWLAASKSGSASDPKRDYIKDLEQAFECIRASGDKSSERNILLAIWEDLKHAIADGAPRNRAFRLQINVLRELFRAGFIDKTKFGRHYRMLDCEISNYSKLSDEDLKAFVAITLDYLKYPIRTSDGDEDRRLDDLSYSCRDRFSDLAEQVLRFTIADPKGPANFHLMLVHKSNLAACVHGRNRAESFQLLNEIIESDEGTSKIGANAWGQKGDFYLDEDKIADASECLRHALESGPGTLEGFRFLSEQITCLYHLQKYAEMRKVSRVLVDSFLGNAEENSSTGQEKSMAYLPTTQGHTPDEYPWAKAIISFCATRQYSYAKELVRAFKSRSYKLPSGDRKMLENFEPKVEDCETKSLLQQVIENSG